MTTVASLAVDLGVNMGNLTSGLRTAENKIKNFGTSMSNVGSDLMNLGGATTVLTAPLAGAMGVGLKVASDFQGVMAEIEARTGATAEEMEQLSAFSLQMGADTAFSGQQAAEGLLQLLTSGSDVEDALKILPSVMDAAAASGEDLGQTADTVTDIMAAFGLGADQAESVVNSLAKAAGASSADIASLGQGFGNVAGVASMFGMDVDQTAAALAILSENGIKGAEAGTALKSMLTNMARPTESVARAWEELGVSMFDSEGEMRDMPTVLTELKRGLENLPAQEQNRIMTELAGTYGVTALNALLGAQGIEDMQASMADAADASDVADARMNTFSGSIDSLKGSFETLMITALTPFMDNFLTPMVQDITSVVNSVTDWVNENPELASSIIAVAAGAAILGPIIVGLGAVISALGTIIAVATGPLGLMALAIGAIAMTDWAAMEDGLNTVGDGIDKIANGNLGEGLNDVASGTGQAIESTFIGQLSNALIDIADQSGVLDAIGLEATTVSEGFAAWGFVLENVVNTIKIGLDDIKRGFDRFGLDIQMQIANMLLSIENALSGTPFEVDWGMENVVADLEAQIAQHDLNSVLHDAIGGQLASGEIDLNEMVQITAPDGSIIEMPLEEAIEGADLSYFSERTKLKITDALELAIAEGDLNEVTVLEETALSLGIDIADLQSDIAALRDDVVSEVEAQDYSANVQVSVAVNAIVDANRSLFDWAGFDTSAMGGGGNVNVTNINVEGSVIDGGQVADLANDGAMNGPQ